MFKQSALRYSVVFILLLSSFSSFSQTNFTDKVSEWKKQFSKADVVATSYKEVVDFFLNPSL